MSESRSLPELPAAHHLALLRHLPPGVLARRALRLVAARSRSAAARRRARHEPTYATDAPAGDLAQWLGALPRATLAANRGWILETAALYRAHRFDVLGSGWQDATHGARCPGFEGHRYEAAAIEAEEVRRATLVNEGNREASRRLWSLVDADYVPIDWQRDLRSGFRWSEAEWSADVRYGHRAGADIKLPWELARFQHAATLAQAFAQGGDESFLREFRSEVLDFAASNPPRFGVNWRSAMDVAIRAANWVLALNLFRAAGGAFDAAFLEALKRSLVDHGRFVVEHLDWFPEGRANHYLADAAGLLFIAAALPSSAETDAWLAFAAQELIAEAAHQFLPDGGNFEGSTYYHRLSGEMVVYGTALLLGLPAERRAAMEAADPDALATRPARPLRRGAGEVDAAHLGRVARIAAFVEGTMKRNGHLPQIGDNDSGRFFKPHPVFAATDEDTLDVRPFLAAANALLGRAEAADLRWLDAQMVLGLAGGAIRRVEAPPAPALPTARATADAAGTTTRITVPGSGLRRGLDHRAFPDFGLYVFRSDRLYLAVRCGPPSGDARGAHAHNDQLAIELAIDGEDWIADPGSYVYTAARRWRNAYRSVAAHAAPRLGDGEPGRLDLGDFWLIGAAGRCLEFADGRFVGEHDGFGRTVRRTVEVADDAILVRDHPGAGGDAACVGRDAARARFASAVPFSPGYGRQRRADDSLTPATGAP